MQMEAVKSLHNFWEFSLTSEVWLFKQTLAVV